MKKLAFASLLLSGIYLSVLALQPRTPVHAQSPAPAMLLVANQQDRDMSIIDPVAAKQVAVVPVSGVTGHEVAATPDGHTAFVPIYGDSGVGRPGTDGREMDVIDIASRKIIGKVDFGHGVRPHCAVYEPVSGMLYVTTELDKTVSIIDPRTLKITGTVPTTQAESHMLAISHDGRRGYTANVGPGTVSVLDLVARKTITVIPISGTTQRISISNDDSMVFTADQTKPQMAVIDTHTNKIKTWIPLPSLGYGTAPTKDGHFLLVTMPSANRVAVVDLRTFQVVRTIDVGKHPTEVLVRPDGLVGYVSCVGSHEVAAIDVPTGTVQTFIQAGQGADGLAWSR